MGEDPIRTYYETGYERERLAAGPSRIEFARTKELLQRFLPPAPATIIDIGGGPGAYAAWLADQGYDVHLVDPVPLHVEQATEVAAGSHRSFTAALGDARSLEQDDSSCDVALMLGPLYHITERDERVRALTEAGRVVRSDGMIAAAAISKFASLLDGLVNGWLGDAVFERIVELDLAVGQHRNPTRHAEWFTTAFFHHPDELRVEVEAAGLEVEGLYGIEGPGWLLRADVGGGRASRENVLRVARAVEQEPTLIGASAHLLAVARRPR